MNNKEGKLENELGYLLSSTGLDNQINYIEKLNNLFGSPIGIAILNSLKELKSVKNKNSKPKINNMKTRTMDIDDQNRAKDYYINSGVDGIHTPRTNIVELNYLDLLKLMDGYAKSMQIPSVNQNIDNEIFLIEQAWIDPMENRDADGYEPSGFVSTEEEAIEICENGGYYTQVDCWSIMRFPDKKMPKYRYKRIKKWNIKKK